MWMCSRSPLPVPRGGSLGQIPGQRCATFDVSCFCSSPPFSSPDPPLAPREASRLSRGVLTKLRVGVGGGGEKKEEKEKREGLQKNGPSPVSSVSEYF